jgi:hypothetical protein
MARLNRPGLTVSVEGSGGNWISTSARFFKRQQKGTPSASWGRKGAFRKGMSCWSELTLPSIKGTPSPQWPGVSIGSPPSLVLGYAARADRDRSEKMTRQNAAKLP